MPREDRKVVFTFGEAYDALGELCAREGDDMPPPSAIARLGYVTSDRSRVFVDFENKATGGVVTVEYEADFIAQALFDSCSKHGIPLPKSSRKTIEFWSDTIVIRIQK